MNSLIKADKYDSLSDLYAQLISYEARLDDRNPTGDSSVNAATRGGKHGGRGRYLDQLGYERGYEQQPQHYEQRGYDQRGYQPRGNGGGNGGRGNLGLR
jgi:hypothetical protein